MSIPWIDNHRELARRIPQDIQHRARIKLEVLAAAESVDDLRIPPSNRLEKLKGDRDDQYSIRVNKQWRICFVWKDGNAWNVGLVDYH
ncbi:MAG TPA: type II toxin-antitoxin system RelE/ParE family toxin [Planctomycetota bacterium]|nr:type II toxin-antitoxin system RelE/ParE family toxin [Planctomycetota bacterium]